MTLEQFLISWQGIVFVVLLAHFLAASVLVCVASWMKKPGFRAITKPMCMAFLGTAALVAAPGEPLIYLAAYCGLLGDIFLQIKKKWAFPVGTVAFLLGHILYVVEILAFLLNRGHLQTPYAFLFIPYAFLAFGLGLIPATLIARKHKALRYFGAFYFACLLTVLSFGILGCALGYWKWMIFVPFGGAFFIFSDLYLTSGMFRQQHKKGSFWVMATYLPAQLLIVVGLVFTAIVTL